MYLLLSILLLGLIYIIWPSKVIWVLVIICMTFRIWQYTCKGGFCVCACVCACMCACCSVRLLATDTNVNWHNTFELEWGVKVTLPANAGLSSVPHWAWQSLCILSHTPTTYCISHTERNKTIFNMLRRPKSLQLCYNTHTRKHTCRPLCRAISVLLGKSSHSRPYWQCLFGLNKTRALSKWLGRDVSLFSEV